MELVLLTVEENPIRLKNKYKQISMYTLIERSFRLRTMRIESFSLKQQAADNEEKVMRERETTKGAVILDVFRYISEEEKNWKYKIYTHTHSNIIKVYSLSL